jgi:uncharacterized protein
MDRELVVRRTAEFVRQKLGSGGADHDWWHAQRVYGTATAIAKGENDADTYVVQLGALMHSIADGKYDNCKADQKTAEKFLKKQGVDDKTISQVSYIINNISSNDAGKKGKVMSKEAMIVQDADRLDALGAIGIARAFAYGGRKGRPIYNPDLIPKDYNSFKEYKKASALDSTTINNFYERLLLLKGRMNTKTGRKMAGDRHAFMEDYLDQFYSEWDGRK